MYLSHAWQLTVSYVSRASSPKNSRGLPTKPSVLRRPTTLALADRYELPEYRTLADWRLIDTTVYTALAPNRFKDFCGD
jgi:hypothetical protein